MTRPVRPVNRLMHAAGLAVSMASTNSALAQGSFQGLGDLPGGPFESEAVAISGDGTVVVGWGTTPAGYDAFRWTASTGMVQMPDLPGGTPGRGVAENVNFDGSVVVGQLRAALGDEPFRWSQATGPVSLGFLPAPNPLLHRAYASDCSADGNVVVGQGNYDFDPQGVTYADAFRWTPGGGIVSLGDLPGGLYASDAHSCSADGAVVVGTGSDATGYKAFRWTAGTGMTSMGTLPGGVQSGAWAITPDGSVIVGESDSSAGREAFRWTQSTGMVGLGDLPGWFVASAAWSVSADGSVIVGIASHSEDTDYSEAFIWDQAHGIRSLKDVLGYDYGINMSGWRLITADSVSDDGRSIVGYAINPQGHGEAYLARLGPVAPGLCYPDCNKDGVLTVADFGCFQTRFVIGCP